MERIVSRLPALGLRTVLLWFLRPSLLVVAIVGGTGMAGAAAASDRTSLYRKEVDQDAESASHRD